MWVAFLKTGTWTGRRREDGSGEVITFEVHVHEGPTFGHPRLCVNSIIILSRFRNKDETLIINLGLVSLLRAILPEVYFTLLTHTCTHIHTHIFINVLLLFKTLISIYIVRDSSFDNRFLQLQRSQTCE